MEQCQFFLITPFDGSKWGADELAEKNPIPRVRELLGGRWDRSSQYQPLIKAFFNGDRRVLVMGFPPGKTREEALEALAQIKNGREDIN